MEGIFNILKNEGIEVAEDVQKRINQKLISEYKSIAEYSNLKRKLEEANNKLSEYTNLNNELSDLRTKHDEVYKLYEDSKKYKYKLEVIQAGINDKFADFVVSEVQGKTNGKKDFTKALEEYKTENPQFLNSNDNKPVLNISTTPNIGNKTELNDMNKLMNDYIRGKL